MVSFGDRLRRARAAVALTQDQLGFAVGLSKQAVSEWENGRSFPSFDTWPKLRAALGISLDDLICGDADAAAIGRAAINLMDEGAGGYEPAERPPVGCARDAKELAMLMRYRALDAKRQAALLDLLGPERPGA